MLAACTYAAVAQNAGTPANNKTFFVAKPGTLVSMLTEDEANSVTHLTLTGKLNAIDFKHLRDEFKNLKVLDISNASISTYAGKSGTYPDRFYIYPPNCVPAYAFCQQTSDSTFTGKATLQKIILSEKIKNIEDAAFKGCENLKICQLRKKTAPNLLPAALADSITAIFVPLGSSDSYRGKKHWDTFAVIEGEPVEAFVQVGLMGSLASELVAAGLQPKDVNFLTVEGKLDEADFTVIRDYMPNLVAVDLSKSNTTVIPEYTFTATAGKITCPKTQTDLLNRIRRERLVELVFEWNRYFDVRRWKVAEGQNDPEHWIYPAYHTGGEGGKVYGMNMDKDYPAFFERTSFETRVAFTKKQYFMPIPYDDLRRIPSLVQNLGW